MFYGNQEMALKVLAAAVTAAHEAGNVIKNVLKKGHLNIVEKGLNDYQTEADRRAQRLICNYLKHHFPRINIVGEEDIQNKPIEDQDILNNLISVEAKHILQLRCPDVYKNITEDECIIWVDPLDGTSEFTQGHLDHVTVLVGIAYKGKAIGGAICQPFYDKSIISLSNKGDTTASLHDTNFKMQNAEGRIIWGMQGLGTFGVQMKSPVPNKLVICTTNSHRSEVVQEALNALKPDEIVHVGGCGMKVLLVIEGLAHAYVYASKGSKKWDTCAPEAILRAAGGTLVDICGNEIDYSASSPNSEIEFVNNANPSLATCDSWWVNNYLGIIATHSSIDVQNIVAKIPTHIKEKLIKEQQEIIAKSKK